MKYLIEGDLVDTVGGWTYLDVWVEFELGKYYVYNSYSGVRADEFNENSGLLLVTKSMDRVNEFMNEGDYY